MNSAPLQSMDVRKILSSVREYASRPFRLDLRSLALFRVGLAVLIVLDLINRALYLEAHYTDFGVMPRQALLDTMWNSSWVSLHMLSGTVLIQAVLFVIAGLVALAMLVGWRTRVMTVVSWIFLISLQARNPLVLQGGDIAFRLLLFWAMFLPLGARWSVDAALADDSDADEQAAELDVEAADDQPLEVTRGYLSMGTIAYVGQIVMVYIFTALLKSGDPWLEDYTAVYYALALDQFTTPIGDFLFEQQFLHAPLTVFTIGLEAVGWALLLIPVFTVVFRLGAIALFAGMHLGFAACMQLGLFSYIMVFAWLALLPGWVWERLGARLDESGDGYLIRHAAPDGLPVKIGQILSTFLFLPDVRVELEPNARGLTVDAPDGTRHTGWAAVVELVDTSPIFSPLSGMLEWYPFRKLGQLAVDGFRFDSVKRSVGGLLRGRRLSYAPSIVGSFLAAGALAVCLVWNLNTYKPSLVDTPSWVSKATIYPRLDQQWNMFSPFPLRDDGWYVIPGNLKDETKVDLFRDGAHPVKWSKPDDVSATYPNQRWRKYMMNLWMSKFENQRLYYGKWLCRRWNRNHDDPDKKLMTFDIYFVKEYTPDPYKDPSTEKVHLWEHHCFENPDSDDEEASADDIADTLLNNNIFDLKDK